jgi:hypothetical protein
LLTCTTGVEHPSSTGFKPSLLDVAGAGAGDPDVAPGGGVVVVVVVVDEGGLVPTGAVVDVGVDVGVDIGVDVDVVAVVRGGAPGVVGDGSSPCAAAASTVTTPTDTTTTSTVMKRRKAHPRPPEVPACRDR